MPCSTGSRFDPVTGMATLDPKRGRWLAAAHWASGSARVEISWRFGYGAQPRIAFHLPDQCDEFRADTFGDWDLGTD